MFSHWVLVDRELRPLAVLFQCVALAIKIRVVINMIHLDLHCHTNCSDGQLSPLELVHLAVDNNITHLAITDHDTVAAHRQLAAVDNLGVNLISGIELSSQWSKAGIHIVGLNIDINSPAIINAEMHQEKVRLQRLERIAYKLHKRGFENILAGAQQEAGTKQV